MSQIYKVIIYQYRSTPVLLRDNVTSENELEQKLNEITSNTQYITHVILDLVDTPSDFDKYRQYYKISNGILMYNTNLKLFIDMQKNKWRKIRNAIFPVLDIEFFKIMEIGSTSKYDRGQLSEWKQRLRDVTKDTHINTLTDIGQILSYTPPILTYLQNEFNVKAV